MQTDVALTIIAVVATLVFFGIIFIIILVYYASRKKKMIQEKIAMEAVFKQEILQTQLETQEYSFNQISEELHDNIGQLLSTTKMMLGIMEVQMIEVPEVLSTAEQTLSKAIQDLRSLSKSLSKEWLNQFNLIDNLQAEVKRINAARQIQLKLISSYERLPMEPESQVMLFRIVQEALQNSIKHAGATCIDIFIFHTNNHLDVSIADNGSGFDFDKLKNESLGLKNMLHRTQLLHGTIEWNKGLEKGTSVNIKLPLAPDSLM